MELINKIKRVFYAFRKSGFREFLPALKAGCWPLFTVDQKTKWLESLPAEIQFWDDYFRTKGLIWADNYGNRFDENLPLQQRPAALLPEQDDVCILDVGAGPLTYLGKVCNRKNVIITAVDPLADEYAKIFKKYKIESVPVKTEKLSAEELAIKFLPNTFDLVFARNCIDHSYNPEQAILQMIAVVKAERFVLLEHRPNEAVNENYVGLHQWNFSLSDDGDFLIKSRFMAVNFTRKYANICNVTSEIINEGRDGDWLVTKIFKKPACD